VSAQDGATCDDGQSGTTDDTCSAGTCSGVAPPEPCDEDLIFQDGFQSEDLSAWTSSSTDGGDLSVSGAAGLASTSLGLQAFVDDTAGLFVEHDSPCEETRYRARFYFDPNGFDPGQGDSHFRTRLLLAFDSLNQRIVTIVLRKIGTVYSVKARVRLDDGTRADTSFFTVSDAPHAIEFDWQKSSGASDGSFELFIDGDSKQTLTGLDNDVSPITFVRMGALSVKTGAAGTLFFDEFEARRLEPIGLL
jgi:hypothetical protein